MNRDGLRVGNGYWHSEERVVKRFLGHLEDGRLWFLGPTSRSYSEDVLLVLCPEADAREAIAQEVEAARVVKEAKALEDTRIAEDTKAAAIEKRKMARLEQKRLAFIEADPLVFDAEGTMARTLGFFATHAHFYVDVLPTYQRWFEDEYLVQTGETPEPIAGLYHVSNDVNKWSYEAEVTFPPNENLPSEIAVLQTATAGKIARVHLMWALWAHGFTLTEMQSIERIRKFIPLDQQEQFDAGLKGENQ